jgi:tetratricopeptide (TPR) repeat protein
MPRKTIADAVSQLLAEHRALSAEELGRLIAAAGLTRSAHPTRAVSRALNDDPRFRRLSDDRWAAPAQLLNGATLTHRLTTEEVGRAALALSPDLAPLAALARVGLLLSDGRTISFAWDSEAREITGTDTDAALIGPPGWLDHEVGTFLHVRLTGALLRLARGPEARAASRLTVRRFVATVRSELDRQAETGILFLPPAVSLENVVLETLADDPGFLDQPLPPLGEALVAGGLEVHRGFVGLPGTDWGPFDEFMSFDDEDWDEEWEDEDDGFNEADEDAGEAMSRDELNAEMAEVFDLEPHEVEGVGIILGAYELSQRLGGFEGFETYAKLARAFAFPGIARVLAVHAWTDPDFEPFVAAVARAAHGRDAAGPRFVLGACAEARQDVLEAERLFRLALEADPTHELALTEIGRYETDRGNYAEALRLLRAARVAPADPERGWLEGLVRPAFSGVGRNQPCPCGSGRKYKVCHLGKSGDVASVEPTTALLHKVSVWLTEPNNERVIRDLEAEVSAADPDPDRLDDEDDSHGGPMLIDVALFDRGCLERFLDVRGVLLPEVERSLGRSWLVTRRSLYEVQAVRPGSGLTLRDLVTDDLIVELHDRSLSRQVEALDLLCLRLLPDGSGGVTSSDGVLVPRPHRSHVLDLVKSGDGLGLLRWIANPNPMPRLQNMEGEPLLFVTATYRVADPAAAARALGRKLRDDGGGQFVETFARRGQDWTRGTITLDGDRATIDANSAKRATRLERTLLRAAPGAELIRREERGVDEVLDEQRTTGKPAEAIDVAAHPKLADAMEQVMRGFETTWVDESIPALGGLTPRQALSDATARPELEALLDDMAWQLRRGGGTGLMDPARIRALLGMANP